MHTDLPAQQDLPDLQDPLAPKVMHLRSLDLRDQQDLRVMLEQLVQPVQQDLQVLKERKALLAQQARPDLRVMSVLRELLVQ